MRKLLLPMLALLALALPAVAQASPHFYLNKVILPETAPEQAISEIGWGYLTLSGPSIGSTTCQTSGTGDLYNPFGGFEGINAVDSFVAYDCANELCTVQGKKAYVNSEFPPESGEWRGGLYTSNRGVVRLRVGQQGLSELGVKLQVGCGKVQGLIVVGQVQPRWANGTAIGSSPSRLVFEPEWETGLELSGGVPGEVKVVGSLLLMEYEGSGLVTAK